MSRILGAIGLTFILRLLVSPGSPGESHIPLPYVRVNRKFPCCCVNIESSRNYARQPNWLPLGIPIFPKGKADEPTEHALLATMAGVFGGCTSRIWWAWNSLGLAGSLSPIARTKQNKTDVLAFSWSAFAGDASDASELYKCMAINLLSSFCSLPGLWEQLRCDKWDLLSAFVVFFYLLA